MPKKVAMIILLCVALTIGGIVFMLPMIEGMKYRNDELKSCSVSTGGGMLGGYSSATLRKDKDGNATLVIVTRKTHADREITTTYNIDPTELSTIAGMVNDYDLFAASKRPLNGIQVLDGDTTSLSFDYSKGYFNISQEQDLNKKMSEGFHKVKDYLYSLANGEGVISIEPQKAMLYLRSGYTEQFIVEDAFDGRLDILNEEHEVAPYHDIGITLVKTQDIHVDDATPITNSNAGTIVYVPSTKEIVILCEDYAFDEQVYQLAHLEDYEVPYATPLIKEMEGTYRLYLN